MPYPISDHCDGQKFFQSGAEPARWRRQAAGFFRRSGSRWRKNSGWASWPKRVENAPHPPPGPPPTVTFIGHSSFLLRLPGLTLLTDPVFSRRCSPSQWVGPKRVRDPGLRLDELPNIDLILLSHNHYDHWTCAPCAASDGFPHAAIVTTLGNAEFLAGKGLQARWSWIGGRPMGWARRASPQPRPGILPPARCGTATRPYGRGSWLAASGRKIYFAGDTGYTKFFAEIRERLGAPDLALLPIGAYEPRWFMGPVHMNPEDAVIAFQDLQARRAVGMHYGTFQLTAEEIDAPQRDLAAALHAAGIERGRFVALDIGESLDLAEVRVPV